VHIRLENVYELTAVHNSDTAVHNSGALLHLPDVCETMCDRQGLHAIEDACIYALQVLLDAHSPAFSLLTVEDLLPAQLQDAYDAAGQ
jgi:hypothetical protein